MLLSGRAEIDLLALLVPLVSHGDSLLRWECEQLRGSGAEGRARGTAEDGG